MWLTALAGQWRIIAEVVILAILLTVIEVQKTRMRLAQAGETKAVSELESYRAQVWAEGMKAQAEAKLKEAEYEAKLQTALTGRADALRRLRDASANRGAMPFTPAPTAGTNICYDRAALESALQRFTTDLQGFIDEGDTALINSRAWAGAWPR